MRLNKETISAAISLQCPHCKAHAVPAFKVMMADVVGWDTRCNSCGSGCSHPGWEKTIITLVALLGLAMCFSFVALEFEHHVGHIRSAIVICLTIALGVAISRFIPLQSGERKNAVQLHGWRRAVAWAVWLALPMAVLIITGMLGFAGPHLTEGHRMFLEQTKFNLLVILVLVIWATHGWLRQEIGRSLRKKDSNKNAG